MKDDTISRAAAIDALGERLIIWSDNDDYTLGERNQYDMDRLAIETMPSAQLAQDLPKGCTDTISRAAVLNLIEQSCCDLEYDCDNVALRKEVEALPPAQPWWIPCSTALPSKYDNYLITTEDGMVVFGVYDPREKQWCRYDSIKSWWIYGIKVLAWQPLPTPYREGGQK